MALVAMVVVVVLLALLLLRVDCGGDGGGSAGSRGGGGGGGGGRGRGRGRRLLVVPPSRGCERNRRSSSALVFRATSKTTVHIPCYAERSSLQLSDFWTSQLRKNAQLCPTFL